jgi:hypothetical protein
MSSRPTDRLERVERMVEPLLLDDPELVLDARVAERACAGRSGRAAPRAAGTSLVLDRVLGREQEERVRALRA